MTGNIRLRNEGDLYYMVMEYVEGRDLRILCLRAVPEEQGERRRGGAACSRPPRNLDTAISNPTTYSSTADW